MDEEKVIEIKGLDKFYGKFHALKDINLNIPKDKVAGLVGPNGAGKTTLLKCITGLLSYEGSISLSKSSNIDMGKIDIGYMPEDDGYYKDLTGKEYLKFYGNLYGLDRIDDLIEEKLRVVEIYEDRNDLIKNYSHGMKKRLGIARTLLHSPRLLIYDEPLLGLDPIIKNKILDIIKEVSVDNNSVLLSSHQLKDIEEICDWIILIKKGEIIDYGSLESLSVKFELTKSIAFKLSPEDIKKAKNIEKEIDSITKIELRKNTMIIYFKSSENIERNILYWMIKNDVNFDLIHGSLDSMYRSVFK